MKKILFIIDKIELKYFEFNKLVTNFWLIKDFLDKNNQVYITTIPNLLLKNNIAFTNCFETFSQDDNIFYKNSLLQFEINSFDLVLFRPVPPGDIDYINATYIFDFVSTNVINSPKAIRDFNEKLHSLYFKEYMTNTLVSSSLQEIENFLNQYKQIVLKPLKLQLALSIPELQDNKEFLEAISLQYKSYNLFEELMEMELMQKRVEFIQTMKESMIDMDVEGNEIKYFSSKFLVQRYLKFSSEDLKLNKKLKEQEIEELNLAGGDNSEMANKQGGNDFGFGESVDYDKLSNMVVEKLAARLNMVTEDDKKETDVVDDSAFKNKKKPSKKKNKKSEEE